jgi:hypothetical protein
LPSSLARIAYRFTVGPAAAGPVGDYQSLRMMSSFVVKKKDKRQAPGSAGSSNASGLGSRLAAQSAA